MSTMTIIKKSYTESENIQNFYVSENSTPTQKKNKTCEILIDAVEFPHDLL